MGRTAIADMLRDAAPTGEPRLGEAFEVADEVGPSVLTFPFAAPLDWGRTG